MNHDAGAQQCVRHCVMLFYQRVSVTGVFFLSFFTDHLSFAKQLVMKSALSLFVMASLLWKSWKYLIFFSDQCVGSGSRSGSVESV